MGKKGAKNVSKEEFGIFARIILFVVGIAILGTIGLYYYASFEYHTADSYAIKIDNTTYQVALSYVGHPEVAWDMCISNLQVLTNQGWVEANATQRAEVICWFADMPSNSLYDECLIGNVDIHGFCP